MTLQVFTGRLWVIDPDAFNVTRGSGGAQAEPFAPSSELLARYLPKRKQAEARASLSLFKGDEQDVWLNYVTEYTQEMRRSYVRHHAAWQELLGRERVVLTCYCPKVARCHRGVLSGILRKLGAQARGEVAMPQRRQVGAR